MTISDFETKSNKVGFPNIGHRILWTIAKNISFKVNEQKQNKMVLFYGVFYLFTRIFVLIGPYYVMIKWILTDINIVHIGIIVSYASIVLIWIYSFYKLFYLYQHLFFMKWALVNDNYFVNRYSNMDDVIYYQEEIINREWIEIYLESELGDIGCIINELLGKQDLIETINTLRSKVKVVSDQSVRFWCY